MPQPLHRTQILLESAQHAALTRMARDQGRSLSDLVREIVRRELEHRASAEAAELERRLEGLEGIRQHRGEVLARLGGRPLDLDVAALIRDLREERDVLGRALGDRR